MKHLIRTALAALMMTAVMTGCTHNPSPSPVADDPQQPSGPADPLHPSFRNDILPIFLTYCSGCHNATTANDGYIFTSYESIIAKKFVAGDPDETKLYEKITEDDEDDRMPQAPNPRLSEDRIQLIRNWILNGAPNN